MPWDQVLNVAAFLAAVGSGLIAGAFFAFSTFVMRALGQRPAAEGMAAMQAINVVVINPMFLGVFLGTAIACVVASVAAALHGQGSAWVFAGAALYVIGTFGVTMACNVPLNNALAAVAPSDPRAAEVWADYLRRWTMWNHVRTVAATFALAAFILGLSR